MTLKDVPGTAADVAYAYDNLGAQTSAAFSSSGQGIASQYDPLGLVGAERYREGRA